MSTQAVAPPATPTTGSPIVAAPDATAPEMRHAAMAYARFGLSQRLEHLVLIASFTLLAITGLPQKFEANAVSERVIAFFGGIEMTRQIHHASAVVLVAQSLFHLVAVAYGFLVMGGRASMGLSWQDLRDVWNSIQYYIGRRKTPPSYGRYTYAEKAEYWALVWGTVIMAITGFMLWNPVATARMLPGEFIPAAKAAHGGEAVLAVLAILLWHFYGVHIKHFNLSMFTGRMGEREMTEEHGLELARLQSDTPIVEVDEDVLRRRRQVFIPLATLLLGGMFIGLVTLITFEQTARAELPVYPDRGAAFVPATTTPAPTRAPTATATTPSPPTATTAPPADVVAPAPTQPAPAAAPPGGGASAATNVVAKAIPHAVAGQETCTLCHSAGPLAMPPSHAGRTDATCQACHKPS